MGLVRGLGEINMGVDVWLKRVETTFVASYRDIVWNIFTQILNNTPQFSGRAVANWNLGIGAPDYSVGANYGDVLFIEGDQSSVRPNQRGDREWIAVAEARNKPKLALIKRDTRVYISNGVSGDAADTGGGSSRTAGFKYLEELQDPAYWMDKLRSVNRPYETVEETMLRMAMEIGVQHGESFRVGGTNMQVRK